MSPPRAMTPIDRILEELTAAEVDFRAADVDALLASHGIEGERRETLRAAVLNHPTVVRAVRPNGARAFTTLATLEREGALLGLADRMAGDAKGAALPAAVTAEERRIAKKSERSGKPDADVLAAVAEVAAPGRLKIIAGGPGTGKSAALKAAARVFARSGVPVVGLGPHARCVADLRANGVPAQGLTELLTDLDGGRTTLPRGAVVLLDEAGMIGTRQMLALLRHADTVAAKVVLVGDHRQLPPLEAGTPFATLLASLPHVEMTRIRRQIDEADRTASQAMRDGRMLEALSSYDARGRVSFARTASAAQWDAARGYVDWVATPENRDRTAAVWTADDATAAALNTKIREVMKARGLLTTDTVFATAAGKRAFGVGDVVTFTRDHALAKDKQRIEVRAGERGRVEQIDGGKLTIRLEDSSQKLKVDIGRFPHIDHGYAFATRSVQGITVDRSFVVDDPGMNEPLAIVALTRHRHAATVHVDAGRHPDIVSLARAWAARPVKLAARDLTVLAPAISARRGTGALRAATPRQEAAQRAIRDTLLRHIGAER